MWLMTWMSRYGLDGLHRYISKRDLKQVNDVVGTFRLVPRFLGKALLAVSV